MKSKLRMALVAFCTLLCLADSEERGSAADPASESEGMEATEEMVIDCSGFDWRESEWIKFNPEGDGKALYVGEYIEGLQYDADFGYEQRYGIRTLCYESHICCMEYFILENEESCYYMNRYDGDTGKITHVELDIERFLEGEEEAEIFDTNIMS